MADQRTRRPLNAIDASFLRTVIAVPMQERIERELAITAQMREQHPELAQQYKTVIFLDKDYHGGIDGARAALDEMLREFDLDAAAGAGRKTVRRRKFVDGFEAGMLLGTLKPALVDFLLSMNESLSSPILQIWPSRWDVIIDINLKFRQLIDYAGEAPGRIATRKAGNPFLDDPRLAARKVIGELINKAKARCGVRDPSQKVDAAKTELSRQYVFARLEGRVVLELARIDRENGVEWAHMRERNQQRQVADLNGDTPHGRALERAFEPPDPRNHRTIYRIWPDFDLRHCTHRSVRTVKADAAQNSFNAYGEGITWAVIDSGIDWLHPHFAMHRNIDVNSPLHRDFTGAATASPLTDEKGHGTHVAGIIAGQQSRAAAPAVPPAAPYAAAWRLDSVRQERDSGNVDDSYVSVATAPLEAIGGMAPKCKLVSLKVLDRFGNGKASNVMSAIAHVQLVNNNGRDIKIHGVNLSLGHNFDARWFACGHSPLCTEVNRLVRSGVVVVVAAGNTGYGVLKSMEGDRNSALDLSINDPANAELAIAVGATHRDAPHMYGVSYFSSKGPTGDGRCKPDLIAPGERIVSAAAFGSKMGEEFGDAEFAYCEASGTSMAAPHVSGAIAAFLSIRNEFIGEAEKVKAIFTASATDLGRERYFQGAGLVDLLRAIQSV